MIVIGGQATRLETVSSSIVLSWSSTVCGCTSGSPCWVIWVFNALCYTSETVSPLACSYNWSCINSNKLHIDNWSYPQTQLKVKGFYETLTVIVEYLTPGFFLIAPHGLVVFMWPKHWLSIKMARGVGCKRRPWSVSGPHLLTPGPCDRFESGVHIQLMSDSSCSFCRHLFAAVFQVQMWPLPKIHIVLV